MSNTQATGVAYSDPEFTTCYASQEIGYSASAQGTVTQATSKSTGVTLNKSAGQITMNNAALAAATNVAFTLTNSLISANDVLIVNVAGGAATAGTYNVFTSALAAGSATIVLRNISAGSLSEAVVINYAIIHGA
jgi:predicted ThiF/HesA family dinucleotide-utilizing enzyme